MWLKAQSQDLIECSVQLVLLQAGERNIVRIGSGGGTVAVAVAVSLGLCF
jgi:hypothetical protein